MNKDELRRYKGVTGYNLGQVEKDYLQHIILGAISRDLAGMLAFKGGTALQKMGIITRFSEDLDFTAKQVPTLERLQRISSGIFSAFNYPVEFDSLTDDERTLSFRMRIRGPLYQGRDSISTLRLEISKRERIMLPPERREINPQYADIIPYVLEVMDLNEILAEKVRAIMTRDKARDLYDLSFIIARNVEVSRDMINRKLAYYNMEFDVDSFMDKCKLLERRWSSEMQILVEMLPPFTEALEEVRRKFSTIHS